MEEALPPKNFHLVLCAAANARRDSWFFGDFIGLFNLLKESGVGGDFISCYPLDEYFADPETPDSIEFGIFRGSAKVTVAYTKLQYQSRSPFYTQIKAADTRAYLLSWLERTLARAQAEDAISVWILSHGNSNGIVLGGEVLDPQTLIKATKGFKNGVQVNIAFSACYSSKFAEAYSKCPQTFRYIQCAAEEYSWAHHETGTLRRRNSRFIQAMVGSIAGEKLASQGYHYRAGQWNVAKHENYIKDQVMRRVSNPNKAATPSFFKDGLQLTSLVKNVLFRDFKDIAYDHRSVSRRGRREWPLSGDSIVEVLDGIETYRPPRAVRDEAVARIRGSFTAFTARGGKSAIFQCDWGFEDSTKASWAEKPDEINCAVYAIYVRARLQSAIWDIIFSLALDGYIDVTKVFRHPVPLNCSERESTAFSAYLCTLEAISNFETAVLGWPQSINNYFDCVVALLADWLATFVIRGMTVPLVRIFNYILDSEWLGSVDEEQLRYIETIYAENIVNFGMPDISKVETGNKLFGFFLPKQPVPDVEKLDNLLLLEALNRDVVKNFADVEEFTKKYFNWDDTIVALQREDRWADQLTKMKSLIPLEVRPEGEGEFYES
ncbi:hypothetical protein TWF718_000471 [Orbilia javanica]|uniref:Uncharacterized protein n=1 Tax=Orbilia javanica TaxID=47235 RepID=A0AAN8N4D6_9PEZI